jgi:hypothetical protein
MVRQVLLPFALVVAGTVVALAALDRLPGVLVGEPSGVWPVPSVRELERRTGARVRLPAFFPDTLAWPPTAVRLAPGRPPSAAVVFASRATGRPVLVVCETLGSAGTISPALLEPAEVLQATPVDISGRPGTLARLTPAAGGVLLEVRWTSLDRTYCLRFFGPLDQLLRMADSLERQDGK